MAGEQDCSLKALSWATQALDAASRGSISLVLMKVSRATRLNIKNLLTKMAKSGR